LIGTAHSGTRAAIWLICLLTLAGGALRAWSVAAHVAVDYDEGRYLDNARNILEGRGLSTHYTSHYFRRAAPFHREDISSPLYPWLLAGTFRLTGVELRPAQIWSWLAGTALIPLTFLLGRRVFGEAAGMVGAGLVALNPDMIIISSWAMTEMIYAVMLLATLLLADASGASSSRMHPARPLLLGIACGAIYLMRANGLAVAAACGLWCLWPAVGEPWRSGSLMRRRLLSVLALAVGFLACVSPWLARNQALFGSPTWSAMKYVAWTESGTDLFTRDAPARTMESFAAEHGPGGLARHMTHRAGRAVGYLIWGDTGAFNIICVFFPLAAVLVWSLPRARPGLYAVVFSALLLVGVPLWTGALSRYLLPARPVIYLVVAGAVFALLGRLSGRAAAIAGALVLAVGVASAAPLRVWLGNDQAARDAVCRDAAAWIAREMPPDAVLMEGALLHQYAFLFDRSVIWAPTGGLGEIDRAATDYGARHIAVSAELLGTRPELRSVFDLGAGREVIPRQLPAGWSELYATRGRRIAIFHMTPVAP